MLKFDMDLTLPPGIKALVDGGRGNGAPRQITDLINEGVKKAATSAYHFWIGLASAGLRTSFQAYKSSMRLTFNPGTTGLTRPRITLGDKNNPWLPVALELGHRPFDMKTAHLKKGKMAAVIPMRHSMRAKRIHVPPKPIVRMMRHHNQLGGAVRNIDNVYKTLSRHTGYMSKYPRYEKLRKTAKGWYTFRKISAKSPARSWWHPGFIGKKFGDRTMEYWINVLSPQIMQPLLDSLSQ